MTKSPADAEREAEAAREAFEAMVSRLRGELSDEVERRIGEFRREIRPSALARRGAARARQAGHRAVRRGEVALHKGEDTLRAGESLGRRMAASAVQDLREQPRHLALTAVAAFAVGLVGSWAAARAMRRA